MTSIREPFRLIALIIEVTLLLIWGLLTVVVGLQQLDYWAHPAQRNLPPQMVWTIYGVSSGILLGGAGLAWGLRRRVLA